MAAKPSFELPVERCPLCGAVGKFKVKGRIDTIPYFGQVMETLMRCEGCNFKHADVMCLGERAPMRYELRVGSSEDMKVRVVRSSSGTIRVPELGVSIEPGPASEGFVSNVEGVLDRIEGVVGLALREAGGEKKHRAEELLEKLRAVREGELQIRLVVMDPLGHSAIVDKRAKKRKLKRTELVSLKRHRG